jgi:hypothetical protein
MRRTHVFLALATSALTLSGLTALPASGSSPPIKAPPGSVAPAAELSWTDPAVIDPPAGGPERVSCPSVDFCVAIDDFGNALTFDGQDWSSAQPVLGDAGSTIRADVSCPTTTYCLALEAGGGYATYDGSSWSDLQKMPPKHGVPYAISCGTPTFCAAVGFGGASTFDGHTWSGLTHLWRSRDYGSSVSCLGSSFCMAVDSHGEAIEYRDGSWGVPVKVLPTQYDYGYVSCATTSSCVFTSNGHWARWNGMTWTGSKSVRGIDGGALDSISCTKPVSCQALDGGGQAFRYNGKSIRLTGQVFDASEFYEASAVSCPTTNACVGVDELGEAATYGDGQWSAILPIDPPRGDLTAVACASPNFCAAGDASGNVVFYRSGGWDAPEQVTPDGSAINEMSCSASTFCALVTASGLVETYDGTDWASKDLGRGRALLHVSCPSAGFCVATDIHGRVSYFDGAHWTKLVNVVGGSDGLYGIGCASKAFCAGIAYFDEVYLYDGTSWQGKGRSGLGARSKWVSCVSATFCAAADEQGYGSVFNGKTWSSQQVDPNSFIESISCRAATCVTASANGFVVTYSGGQWSDPVRADIYNSRLVVACGSPSFCVGVDQYGKEVTGTRE